VGWQAKVLKVLEGITDPELRSNVSSTVFFLLDVYATGKVEEAEVKRDLTDIFKDVIAYKHPEMPPPQVLEEARKIAEDLLRDARLMRMTRITMGRARARTMPGGFE